MARHFLLTLYDHLGRVVLLNILWLVAVTPWLAVGAVFVQLGSVAADTWTEPGLRLVGLGVAGMLAVLSPPTLFLVAATAPWVHGRDPGLRAALVVTRRQAARAQVVGLCGALAVGLLLGNAVFYLRWESWLGLALCGFMLWMVFGVGLLAVYVLPLLAARPATLRQTLRDSAVLTLSNLPSTVALAVAVVMIALVGLVTGVGLALGAVSALALLANTGLARLFARHGGQPLERDPRGWRDLLRPWES